MDPLTHALVGVTISKLGAQPISLENPAFVGAVIGAVVPDIDIVLQKWGDYVYLKNHRGMSHSLVALGVFSIVITFGLMLFYQHINFWNVFIWTFLGCLSHDIMDLLNSYGVKLLWPLYQKKLGFGLFIIFDPIIFSLLFVCSISSRETAYISFGIFNFYIVLRILMMYSIQYIVKQYFRVKWNNVNVLPSVVGLFKWHFVINTSQSVIVGEKMIYRRKFTIIKNLKPIDNKMLERVMHTPIAKFFEEFTPLYHVAWDEMEKTFKFIDVRYYIRNAFLHHATARVNEHFEIVDQRFHPYSMKRSVEIPS